MRILNQVSGISAHGSGNVSLKRLKFITIILGLSSVLCKELIERSRNPNQPKNEDLDAEDEYELNGPIHVRGSGGKDLETPSPSTPPGSDISHRIESPGNYMVTTGDYIVW